MAVLYWHGLGWTELCWHGMCCDVLCLVGLGWAGLVWVGGWYGDGEVGWGGMKWWGGVGVWGGVGRSQMARGGVGNGQDCEWHDGGRGMVG